MPLKKTNHRNLDWLQHPDLQLIFSVIEKAGGTCRIVGGAIRNYLLELPIFDIDIACDLDIDTLSEIFTKANIRIIEVGKSFGVIEVILSDLDEETNHHHHYRTYQIASLRKDIHPDGRHTKIAFTDSWREDALRRDFTINALYLDLNQQLYDWYDGLLDIENRVLRFYR